MIHDISSQSLDAIATHLPADAPLFMLNLLRFRPDRGREIYFEHYVTAFRAVMAAQGLDGIHPVWTGSVAGMIAGPDGEAWDAVLMVQYPSLSAFRAIVESEQYRTRAAPHREAALADWRLIAQTEMVRPS